mgnify:CR=1 FL=1
MTVRELMDEDVFQVLNEGENTDREISQPFCCDLLSIAMSKAPAGAAWVTVMGNMNTLAVATLTECACIILAEGIQMDEAALKKADAEGITVFATEAPIFETGLTVIRIMETYE